MRIDLAWQSFLDWWLGELRGLAAALRLPLGGPPRRLLVAAPAGGGWRLERWRDGQLERAADIEAGGLGAAVRGLSRRGPLPLCLRLPRDQVFRLRLVLAQEARANLLEILQADLQRATSFAPEELGLDYRILGRDAAARSFEVEVAAAPRESLAALSERLGREGLRPARIDAEGEGPAEAAGAGFDLTAGQRGGAGGGRALRALALLALLLLALLLGGPLWQKTSARDALAARSEALQGEARLVAGLQGRIEALATAEQEVRTRKATSLSNLLLLAELTDRLPDDTWLLELSRNGEQVRISGFSAQPSALIGRLESSPLFRNVGFAQPVVQDPYEQAAQFLIALELEEMQP